MIESLFKKKLLASAIALSVVVSLTACGGSSDKDDPESDVEPPVVEQSAVNIKVTVDVPVSLLGAVTTGDPEATDTVAQQVLDFFISSAHAETASNVQVQAVRIDNDGNITEIFENINLVYDAQGFYTLDLPTELSADVILLASNEDVKVGDEVPGFCTSAVSDDVFIDVASTIATQAVVESDANLATLSVDAVENFFDLVKAETPSTQELNEELEDADLSDLNTAINTLLSETSEAVEEEVAFDSEISAVENSVALSAQQFFEQGNGFGWFVAELDESDGTVYEAYLDQGFIPADGTSEVQRQLGYDSFTSSEIYDTGLVTDAEASSHPLNFLGEFELTTTGWQVINDFAQLSSFDENGHIVLEGTINAADTWQLHTGTVANLSGQSIKAFLAYDDELAAFVSSGATFSAGAQAMQELYYQPVDQYFIEHNRVSESLCEFPSVDPAALGGLCNTVYPADSGVDPLSITSLADMQVASKDATDLTSIYSLYDEVSVQILEDGSVHFLWDNFNGTFADLNVSITLETLEQGGETLYIIEIPQSVSDAIADQGLYDGGDYVDEFDSKQFFSVYEGIMRQGVVQSAVLNPSYQGGWVFNEVAYNDVDAAVDFDIAINGESESGVSTGESESGVSTGLTFTDAELSGNVMFNAYQDEDTGNGHIDKFTFNADGTLLLEDLNADLSTSGSSSSGTWDVINGNLQITLPSDNEQFFIYKTEESSDVLGTGVSGTIVKWESLASGDEYWFDNGADASTVATAINNL